MRCVRSHPRDIAGAGFLRAGRQFPGVKIVVVTPCTVFSQRYRAFAQVLKGFPGKCEAEDCGAPR
jgi:hypothetical protein